tara:strand:- start:654 stop:851 length:198 start_codon:yes stop_codon:yes gene_type:complete
MSKGKTGKPKGAPKSTGNFNTREELHKAIYERSRSGHSNTHIGRHTGVSRETVRTIRQDLFEQHY